MKMCTRCFVIKDDSSFHAGKGNNKCKECRNFLAKEYRKLVKLDPIKYAHMRKLRRQSVVRYGKRHPDRIAEQRRNRGNGKQKLRFQLLLLYCFTCQYCGRRAPEVRLAIDHKIPKSKGGSFSKENLTVACWECNSGKSDILLS